MRNPSGSFYLDSFLINKLNAVRVSVDPITGAYVYRLGSGSIVNVTGDQWELEGRTGIGFESLKAEIERRKMLPVLASYAAQASAEEKERELIEKRKDKFLADGWRVYQGMVLAGQDPRWQVEEWGSRRIGLGEVKDHIDVSLGSVWLNFDASKDEAHGSAEGKQITSWRGAIQRLKKYGNYEEPGREELKGMPKRNPLNPNSLREMLSTHRMDDASIRVWEMFERFTKPDSSQIAEIVKVADVIARLDGKEQPIARHYAEAWQYATRGTEIIGAVAGLKEAAQDMEPAYRGGGLSPIAKRAREILAEMGMALNPSPKYFYIQGRDDTRAGNKVRSLAEFERRYASQVQETSWAMPNDLYREYLNGAADAVQDIPVQGGSERVAEIMREFRAKGGRIENPADVRRQEHGFNVMIYEGTYSGRKEIKFSAFSIDKGFADRFNATAREEAKGSNTYYVEVEGGYDTRDVAGMGWASARKTIVASNLSKRDAKAKLEELWRGFLQGDRVKNPYTDPQLREQLKAEIMAAGKGGRPGEWSARKAQMVAQAYEAAGGGYIGGRSAEQKSLVKWTGEDWGTRSGKPSIQGPDATGERYLPRDVRESMSREEYARATAAKRRAIGRGEQYSRQPNPYTTGSQYPVRWGLLSPRGKEISPVTGEKHHEEIAKRIGANSPGSVRGHREGYISFTIYSNGASEFGGGTESTSQLKTIQRFLDSAPEATDLVEWWWQDEGTPGEAETPREASIELGRRIREMKERNPSRIDADAAHLWQGKITSGAGSIGRGEQYSRQPNPYTGSRLHLSPAALAADYKARGISRSRAWSQFIIDRALKPGIDAKDFYQYYDSVSPKLLVDDVVEPVKASYVDPEYADSGKRVRVTIKFGRHTEEREGVVYRTLQGGDGSVVYEVDFGDGPQRLRSSDTVQFLNPSRIDADAAHLRNPLDWYEMGYSVGTDDWKAKNVGLDTGDPNDVIQRWFTEQISRARAFDKITAKEEAKFKSQFSQGYWDGLTQRRTPKNRRRNPESSLEHAFVEAGRKVGLDWNSSILVPDFDRTQRAFKIAAKEIGTDVKRSDTQPNAPLMRAFIDGIRETYKKGKRNPESSAASVYEEFHGKPSESVLDIEFEEHEHEHLAALGTLVQIIIITPFKKEAELNAPDPNESPVEDHVLLCSNEEKTQLYLVGGDQSLNDEFLEKLGFKQDKNDFKDFMVLGLLKEVTYRTEKGFDKFKSIDYYHELGEETGMVPVLIYDYRSGLLRIAGGQYEIKDVGIVN